MGTKERLNSIEKRIDRLCVCVRGLEQPPRDVRDIEVFSRGHMFVHRGTHWESPGNELWESPSNELLIFDNKKNVARYKIWQSVRFKD